MYGLVSIIMPSYNTAQYIKNSIDSILAHTYKNWELLIVDDCSTDNTDEIVAQFNDSRITYVKNEKNSGAAISRNRALKMAKGKWIAFLDSDDLWTPDKLEKQLAFMVTNNYHFTYTDYRICLNGVWQPHVMTGPKSVGKWKMYNYCYFSTITVIYDREWVGLIEIADLRKNNDYAMWFQAVKKTRCYRFPGCYSFYIKHEGSVSSGKKWKLIKYHYILFRKGLSKGPILSAILTFNNLVHGVLKKYIYRIPAHGEGE